MWPLKAWTILEKLNMLIKASYTSKKENRLSIFLMGGIAKQNCRRARGVGEIVMVIFRIKFNYKLGIYYR